MVAAYIFQLCLVIRFETYVSIYEHPMYWNYKFF